MTQNNSILTMLHGPWSAHTGKIRSAALAFSLKCFTTFVLLPSVLIITGCEQKTVYNDDYEMPGEPDIFLRNLLGVRTLRSSFEMPEGMRRFRTGLIFVEKGQVTGSNGWTWGDGLHTNHSNGKREYAKTIHVEYMNQYDGEEWRGLFRVVPSHFSKNLQVNRTFWDKFENDSMRTTGFNQELWQETLGEFTVLAAWFGSEESSTIGPLDSLLANMDYLALLVVDFSPLSGEESENPYAYPTNAELNKLIQK